MYQSGRSLEELERQFIVRAGKRITRAYVNYFHDLRILAPCPIPPVGPGLIVCNHTSSLDPFLLQTATSRMITWMMAREYGSLFGVKWFFRAIEPILVERSGRDLAATREALRALEAGKLIGVFPEGRLETTRELLDFQPGVAMLAIKSGAPIYPACIDGMTRGKGMLEVFIRPNRCTISFGPPIHLERPKNGKLDLEAATATIKAAVAQLAAFPRE